MKRSIHCGFSALLAFALLVPGLASAGSSAESPVMSATVPMTRQIDFQSKVNGRHYRIQVALPLTAPPEKGFPVIYVLDGDGYFGTWSSAARFRAMAGELEPAVVVGIGYPESEQDVMATMQRRMSELSPSVDEMMAKMAEPGAPAPHAGADDLLQVIHREIPPLVAAVTKVDASRSTLFGHSLGGLFAVHALFTHPDYFGTYLVLSPSIWVNRRAVLAGEPAFLSQVQAGKISARVYLAVGSKEQPAEGDPLPGGAPKGMTEAELRAMVASAAMVDNTRELLRNLQVKGAAPGYEVKGRVVPNETHNSVAWAVVNEMLDFAIAAKSGP